jgi:hypothetical protein
VTGAVVLPDGVLSIGSVVTGMARKGAPTIDVVDHDVATQRAWEEIERSNDFSSAGDFIFRYGELPCRFEHNDLDKLVPRQLTRERMRHRLNQIIRWVRTNGKGETVVQPAAPNEVVGNILATPDPPLPVVQRIVEVPILGPNGVVVRKAGYNRPARVFYEPDRRIEVPPVERKPSAKDRARALALIDDVIQDFPFKEPSDRAHAICLFLQPFVRDLIKGPTPLFAVEAPTPGTGKGKLVRTLLWPANGCEPRKIIAGEQEDEWRKRITASLLASPSALMIDNVGKIPLDSEALSSLLTSEFWSDRVLGRSAEVELPNRATWIVTGNNISMSAEMNRRVVRIYLDSEEEFPEDRATFAHADLDRYVIEQRGELIWAALTLARAWVASGRPEDRSVPALGSFESWRKVMGGILKTAGVPGLLGNRVEQRERSGSERETMSEFLGAWWRVYEDRPVKIGELRPDVVEAVGLDPTRDGWQQALGQKLHRHSDRWFGGYVARRARHPDGTPMKRNNSGLWCVESNGEEGD